MNNISYARGIWDAHDYLLSNYHNIFVFGQGLWSPWYVGATMNDLDKKYGENRIIDSPISEVAVTGAALGASLCGYRPIVVHPRMDFMILAVDQIVSQAAKWSHMFGGQANAPLTIRGIVNRGGEQGAQHSQSLHSWFAHIPGLRVVMPATPRDARDLLIASALCDDPVLYIDDRWLYESEEEVPEIEEFDLRDIKPLVRIIGSDITLIASSYSYRLCVDAAKILLSEGISCEVIDLRVINPIHYSDIVDSVEKTGRFIAVDGGWTNCGLAGEIIAGVLERISLDRLKVRPQRLTLTDTPAPTSKPLEKNYYTTVADVTDAIKQLFK